MIAARRGPIGLAAVCASILGLIALAGPARAERTYESQMALSSPHALAIDTADNVWVTETGIGVVSQYDPYPSTTLLKQRDGEGHVGGYYMWGLGVNSATGYIYVADSGPVVVNVIDNNGGFVEAWNGFNGGYDFVSVDDSGGPTNGRVYIAADGGTVLAVDGSNNPINFTAPQPWVEGNKLTGSPAGNFSRPWNVYVDRDANVWVVDQGNHEVIEFDPTGEFVRTIKDEDVPGGFGEPTGVAVDPTSGNVLVVDSGYNVVDEFDSTGFIGSIAGTGPGTPFTHLAGGIAVSSSGYVYVSDKEANVVDIFSPNTILPKVVYGDPTNPGQTSMTVNATIDPNGGPEVTECHLDYGTSSSYGSTLPCDPDPATTTHFTVPTDVSVSLSGLTTEGVYHYRFVATTANGVKKGADKTFIPHAVAGLATDPATNLEPTSAKLNGSWVGNGEDTHFFFEWGTTNGYGTSTSSIDAGASVGPKSVSFDLTGLLPITEYHFRIVANNSTGTSYGEDRSFTTPPNAPIVNEWVSGVHSDTAVLNASINPGGGTTTYRFEWGLSTGYGTIVTPAEPSVGSGIEFVDVSNVVSGLAPGTTYHYRVVATNAQDETLGPDRTFKTFPFTSVLDDPCPNALVRKQTGSALLPDCRAFELASAVDQGGYDVESDLVQGQSPLAGYPAASGPSRLLYAVHFGAIPGTDHPTNLGPDPYVATRGEGGWTTRYVGVPANGAPGAEPFGSPLLGADATLSNFAFGGATLCDPCFGDGSTGVPIRLADGSLVQGMVGSIGVVEPTPAGYIRRPLSADGSHFVFGSTQKFEPDGNSGQISIYDRNLTTGVTKVVSKTPGGATMTGAGIAELDISANGSRIVIGQLTGTDGKGNSLYHLYMNVGDSGSTIDLMPGATTGALYGGMSSDGGRVLFTTRDALSSDSDTSADVYRADVSAAGATLTRASTGSEGAGNTNSCAPAGNWNTPAGGPNCDVVPIAGGGGVGSDDGSVYFVSPEKLDGGSNGAADEPNLYVARPGSGPEYVATLEIANPAVTHGVAAAGARNTADFEVSRNGDFAVFASDLPLSGYDNDGHTEIYRYAEPTDQLECASCAPTGVRATGDATLARNGSSLTDDGRVFLTSSEPLAPRDLNGKLDAYEWEDGVVDLISSGSSPFDSGLLSVSDDGVDAYVFTHDVLAPQDKNGTVMKIYDAREEGGFLEIAPPQPCQASDECHGRGTDAPPPPSIRTVTGTRKAPPRPGSEPKKCKRRKILRKGRCVTRAKHRGRHSRHTTHSHG